MRTTAVLFLVSVVVVSMSCRRTQQPAPTTIGPATQAGTVAASSTVPELPDYPGAVRVGFELKGPGDGYAQRVEAKFTTADALPTVRAFYQDAIVKGGWQVVASEEKASKVEWKLAKGTSVAEVDIEAESVGGLKISLKRKDR